MSTQIQRSNKVDDIMYKNSIYRGTFDMNFSLLGPKAGLKGFREKKQKTNHSSSGQLQHQHPEGRGKDWKKAMPSKFLVS